MPLPSANALPLAAPCASPDLWSRYVVGWMIAERENSLPAKQLFAEAIRRYGIDPNALTTSHGFRQLLEQLGVEHSLSRPRKQIPHARQEVLDRAAPRAIPRRTPRGPSAPSAVAINPWCPDEPALSARRFLDSANRP